MKKVRQIYLSILIFLVPTTAFTQYNVGSDDGFAVSCYAQSDNPYLAIYSVGSDDGFAVSCYAQSDNPYLAIYSVGSDDGFAVSCYAQSDNPYLAIYSVGSDDGFAVSCVGSMGSEVPLPIVLILFEAECVQNKVLLKWATASEINNDYFTIERSVDAMHFEIVGTVEGAENSSTTLHYEFVDSEIPPSGNGVALYYRLKQTDFDGQVEYFNIISVNCRGNNIGDIKVYPNPVSNELIIKIAENTVPVNFEISDAQGSLIYKGNLIEKTTVQTSSFASGVYLIKFGNGKTFEFRKAIKE